MSVVSISTAILLALLVYGALRARKARQLVYIENYRFNSAILTKVQQRYPHLNKNDLELVIEGLREYFYVCRMAKNRPVSMPSQVVDVAWHEFILYTRLYDSFCKKALGRFLHHTPAEAMRSPRVAQEGIKRAWRLCCAKHNIDPKAPLQLPLLFAIDSLLKIEDGFKYSLDCRGKGREDYCASHIGCSSGCSGSSCASDSDGFFGGGDSSSCGSGCGGD